MQYSTVLFFGDGFSGEERASYKSFEGRKAASTPSAISSTLYGVASGKREGSDQKKVDMQLLRVCEQNVTDDSSHLTQNLLDTNPSIPSAPSVETYAWYTTYCSALTRSEILELGIEIPSIPLHFFRKGSVSFQTTVAKFRREVVI